jgi:hypothetical protein
MGATGPMGATGTQGPTGAQGFTGPAGPAGLAGQTAMLTNTSATPQLFGTINTVVQWGVDVSGNSTGTTGISYIGAQGSFKNTTSATLAVEVQYNLIWNESVSGATYINIGPQGTQYSLTQYNSYVMTNSGTFLLAPNQYFTIYAHNSSDSISLQTASSIIVTILTAGEQGPQGPAGVKPFIIDHPIKENYYLIHACMEGPEAGVYYRGKATVLNRFVIVTLPDYVDYLASDFTVHVTHEIDETEDLIQVSATRVFNNQFRIYASAPCTANWLVVGNRKNTTFPIEPPKNTITINGEGPYKYML